MNHGETSVSSIYLSCRDYLRQINNCARLRGSQLPEIGIVSESALQAVWNQLSESQREHWLQKFEAGHNAVAIGERRRLAAAFTADESPASEFHAIRAA